jgi:hypothetical protein
VLRLVIGDAAIAPMSDSTSAARTSTPCVRKYLAGHRGTRIGDKRDGVVGFMSRPQRGHEIAQRVRVARTVAGRHDVLRISTAVEEADVRQRGGQ